MARSKQTVAAATQRQSASVAAASSSADAKQPRKAPEAKQKRDKPKPRTLQNLYKKAQTDREWTHPDAPPNRSRKQKTPAEIRAEKKRLERIEKARHERSEEHLKYLMMREEGRYPNFFAKHQGTRVPVLDAEGKPVLKQATRKVKAEDGTVTEEPQVDDEGKPVMQHVYRKVGATPDVRKMSWRRLIKTQVRRMAPHSEEARCNVDEMMAESLGEYVFGEQVVPMIRDAGVRRVDSQPGARSNVGPKGDRDRKLIFASPNEAHADSAARAIIASLTEKSPDSEFLQDYLKYQQVALAQEAIRAEDQHRVLVDQYEWNMAHKTLQNPHSSERDIYRAKLTIAEVEARELKRRKKRMEHQLQKREFRLDDLKADLAKVEAQKPTDAEAKAARKKRKESLKEQITHAEAALAALKENGPQHIDLKHCENEIEKHRHTIREIKKTCAAKGIDLTEAAPSPEPPVVKKPSQKKSSKKAAAQDDDEPQGGDAMELDQQEEE